MRLFSLECPPQKNKLTRYCIFIKYWNRYYIVNAGFFSPKSLWKLICMYLIILYFVYVCVCSLSHILNKNAILLSMSWDSEQTDQSLSTRHHSAGHVRLCKAWWLPKWRADTQDYILLFVPPLMSLVFFYVIHVTIMSLLFQKLNRF